MDGVRRSLEGALVALALVLAGGCGSAPTPPAPAATAAAPTDAPAATAAPTESAVAEDVLDARRGLLVNLTTDDTWSANMALSLATTARKEGMEPVIIFLNVRGVYLADSGRMPAREGNSELNIHEKLQAFIAEGGQVIACPSCSKEAGLMQEDYIEGVVIGEPGGIIQFLSDPGIAVVSYPHHRQ